MAEVMTFVGTVASFSQLASQIITSIQTIHSFLHQVKNAPKHVSSLLEDIGSTSLLLQCLADEDKSNGDELTLKTLKLAKEVLEELQDLLKGLNMGIKKNGWKERVKWGNIKVLGKEQLVTAMVERLERAKSSLNGALLHQLL
jgi:hypothetical protein